MERRFLTIVLLTDFGESEYVGIMKGVIRQNAPRGDIIDLTHSIMSHEIIEAAWVLYKSYRFFPDQSTFCVVVDPGVGTSRQAVVIRTRKYYFVGPDNGVLWQSATEDGVKEVVLLNTENTSPTFHGRDVFAPVAACLDAGIAHLPSLGKATELQQKLELNPLTPNSGMVVRIDQFGNIITNLPKPAVLENLELQLRQMAKSIKIDFFRTFAEGPSNKPFAIIGSAETVEIVLRNGRAADILGIRPGESVELRPINS
ncbi:MAG: SAM hydrolase/SAM-dependent halogenase family protein [Candidatus Hodarchaeales archaeon]|jgi:S-adenosylmethionine hydrolase